MNDLLIAARAVHIAATIMAVGIVAFAVCVLAPTLRQVATPPKDVEALRRSLRRAAMFGVMVATVSGAVWIAIFASEVAADASNSSALAVAVLTQTQFGRLSVIRLAVAGVLGWLVCASEWNSGTRGRVILVLVTIFAGVLAASGHAGAVPGPWGAFGLAGDVLHIVAAGIWLGGLLPLAWVLARARQTRDPAWAAIAASCTRRFASLALASVVVIAATGSATAALLVGSVDNLVATSYGQLLLAKLAVVLAMLGFAAVNRLALTPALPQRRALAGLRRNSLAEVALGLFVTALVGALGTLPPAAHHHLQTNNPETDAAFVHLHGTAGMAEITITPGHPGPVEVKVTLLADDFTPLAARAVTFTLSSKSAGIAPKTRRATRLDEGNWRVEGLEIPLAGRWDVLVEAEIDGSRQLSLDGPMLIKP